MSVYYSTDKTRWFVAREYLKNSFFKAEEFFMNPDKENPFEKYAQAFGFYFGISANGQDIFFSIQKSENNMYKYTQIDGYICYLCRNPITKMYAFKELKAEHLDSIINIPQGSTYYVYMENKNKPIIGLNGSYNPPLDINGNSFV